MSLVRMSYWRSLDHYLSGHASDERSGCCSFDSCMTSAHQAGRLPARTLRSSTNRYLSSFFRKKSVAHVQAKLPFGITPKYLPLLYHLIDELVLQGRAPESRICIPHGRIRLSEVTRGRLLAMLGRAVVRGFSAFGRNSFSSSRRNNLR